MAQVADTSYNVSHLPHFVEIGKVQRRVVASDRDVDTYLQELTDEQRERAESYLFRTAKGFNIDVVTPLIGRDSPDYSAVRSRIRDEMLSRVGNTSLEALDLAEIAQSEKIGPWSIMLPYRERVEEVARYYSHTSRSINMRILEMAAGILANRVPAHSLQPLNLSDAFAIMPRKTNLGAPFFSSDERYLPELYRRSRELERSGFTNEDALHPALLFWRGQARGLHEVPKQRSVFGYPHIITPHELRLQGVLLPILRGWSEFAALVSAHAVDEEVSKILVDAKISRNPIVSVDFSSFDATVPEIVVRTFFSLLRYWFVPSARRLIDFVEDRFLHIPLMTPAGIIDGVHGVPSGSGWTNQLDSFVQLLLLYSLSIEEKVQLRHVLVQGDDGVWAFNRSIPPEELSEYASQWGLALSSEKGNVAIDSVHFLQNIHMAQYLQGGLNVGVRPILRVVNGMLSFERIPSSEWRAADNTIRWLQQCESAKWHPRFNALADFLLKGDVLLRRYTIPQVVHMAGGMSEIEAQLREKSFPFGKFPIRGLYDFAIVKEINQLKGGKPVKR